MTADHRQNPKLLWGIAGSLVVIIIAIFAISQWLTAPNDALTMPHQDDMTIRVPETVTEPTSTANATLETAASDATSANALIDSSILDEAVSENATLAKEEIAKLDDIQQQLTEQETTLQQQHLDAEELIQLKEEQIKLLEAQLAAE